tara:strand:+ start:154 stop:678 length:525 start_codon:yes stop_codon:yes gene_type:complete
MENKNKEIIHGCTLHSFLLPNCGFQGAVMRVSLDHEETDIDDCREITFQNYARDDWQVFEDLCLELDEGIDVHFWDFSEEEQSRVLEENRDEFVDAHRQFLRSTFKWSHVRTDKEQKLVNFMLDEINFFKCDIGKNNFLDWFLVAANALNDHDHYELKSSETWSGNPLTFFYEE